MASEMRDNHLIAVVLYEIKYKRGRGARLAKM